MTPLPYEYQDTLLQVRGISVHYGDHHVLRNLDMEIRNLVRPGLTQGQVVALLGPSGVGKTTLFRILAGLDAPDAGTVLVGAEGKPVQRGTVGVVAQNYPLFAHRTVLGNLTVAGRQSGLSGGKALEMAERLLKRFGLEEHGRKYPVQLSGGQRQRVAIAQQFMCSEDLILMDEPFSGLDVVAARNVIEMIQEMAAADELKTFILVTHDVAAALEVSDHVFLIGRDRNPDGSIVPGARIQKEYDLCARGLAWQEGISTSPEFLALLQEIRDAFPRL